MPTTLRFYLESSFWSRLVDRTDPARRRASRRFLRWAGPRHFLLTSELVRTEIEATQDPNQGRQIHRLYDAARKRNIPMVPEVRRVARELILRGALTPNHLADAYHVGYAIVSRVDALVTWNIRDLARPWTRRVVSDFCWERGLPELRIGNPQEVGRWLNVEI